MVCFVIDMISIGALVSLLDVARPRELFKQPLTLKGNCVCPFPSKPVYRENPLLYNEPLPAPPMTILAAPPSSDDDVTDAHDDIDDDVDIDDDDDDSFGPVYSPRPKTPNNGSNGSNGSSRSRTSAKPKKDSKSVQQSESAESAESAEPFTPSYALRSLGSPPSPHNYKSSTSAGATRSSGVSGTLDTQDTADEASHRDPEEESPPPTVPFEVNTVMIMDLGSIKASPNYYTRKSLYPVGYKSSRLYTSIFRLEFVFSLFDIQRQDSIHF